MAKGESSHYHCYSCADDCAPVCAQLPTRTTSILSMILMTLQNSTMLDSAGNWENECPSSGLKDNTYRVIEKDGWDLKPLQLKKY